MLLARAVMRVQVRTIRRTDAAILAMAVACLVGCGEVRSALQDGSTTCTVDNDCDDGIACTVGSCAPGGTCSFVPVDVLCDDGRDCTEGSCAAGQGCVYIYKPADTPCRDGGGSEGVCEAGECLVSCERDGDCDDGNDCTAGSCSAGAICEHDPVADGVACAGGGVCAGGECVECILASDCEQGSVCVAVSCDDGTCVQNLRDDLCFDGNPCTADLCTPQGCGFEPVQDGAPCGSGGALTCQAGQCVGCSAPEDCEDGVACTQSACQGNICSNDPDDAQCDDDNECTANVCTRTGCESTPLPEGAPCSEGFCSGDECVECAGPQQCDDGVSCTIAACDGGSCSFEPDDGACDDGNECTLNACDGEAGCVEAAVDDGELCDGGRGVCQAGTCRERAGFRIDLLELQHPHAIADRDFGVAAACDDFTFEDLRVSGFLVARALNDQLASDVDELRLNYVGLFQPLDQGAGFEGDGALVRSDCSSAQSCVPTPGGDTATGLYRVSRSGVCLEDVPGLFEGVWPDGRVTDLNRPAAAGSGCFVTDPIELVLEVTVADATIDLPLKDAQLAGSFAGEPATRIENGLIIGFLTQAEADAINFTVTAPGGIQVGINLGRDVLPDNSGAGGPVAGCEPRSHCTGPDARVTHDGECGWWFAVNFTAARINDTSAY
jgi:hypothetical protein